VPISKLTDDIVKTVAPEVKSVYLPHAVDNDIFKPLPEEEIKEFKEKAFTANNNQDISFDDKTVFFFNSRNARRKQIASLVFWFKDFLDEVGHDKAVLICHTNPYDENGSNLEACVSHLGLSDGQILFSRQKVDNTILAKIYNMVDCTVLISDAEGFGLAVNESLSCGTPVICTMTGGLQEQVFDGKQYFGVGIKPTSECVVGSQEIPWIYESRVAKEDVIAALKKIHNLTPKQRKELGLKGREHILKNYGFDNYCKKWVEVIDKTLEENGSWDTRKNYQGWSLTEIV
jgi:glycosyltransferase involved in cell wall biosynthesis